MNVTSKITTKTDSRMAKGGDTRDRPDANGNLAQTKSGRAGDLKIMNLLILIDSAQMFFRNFGLRHGGAAFGDFAIELARPKAGRVIMAIFARPVEWLRSRLCPLPPEKSIEAQFQKEKVFAAEVSFRP